MDYTLSGMNGDSNLIEASAWNERQPLVQFFQ
jgi:hypothetical protein